MNQPKTFEQIKALIAKKFTPLHDIDHNYLNEQGKFMYEVYDTLDYCISEDTTIESFIENVRNEINDCHRIRPWQSTETTEQLAKVAAKLRKFVRWHIAKELWENIPEFANRKEN